VFTIYFPTLVKFPNKKRKLNGKPGFSPDIISDPPYSLLEFPYR